MGNSSANGGSSSGGNSSSSNNSNNNSATTATNSSTQVNNNNWSQSPPYRSYSASGRWDPRDPVFANLNQETSKDGRALMSVAIDLVIKGIQEPVRFVLDTKVRIFPQNERFWYFTKKPLLHLFALKLKQAEITSSTSSLDEAHYEMTNVENMGEVERFRAPPFSTAGLSLPLNLASLTSSLSGSIRSPSISSIDTPGADEDTGQWLCIVY